MTPTIALLIIIAACLVNSEERAASEQRKKDSEARHRYIQNESFKEWLERKRDEQEYKQYTAEHRWDWVLGTAEERAKDKARAAANRAKLLRLFRITRKD